MEVEPRLTPAQLRRYAALDQAAGILENYASKEGATKEFKTVAEQARARADKFLSAARINARVKYQKAGIASEGEYPPC